MNNNNLKLQTIESLKSVGVAVRVRDFGRNFRIVLTNSQRVIVGEKVETVLNGMGYTTAGGQPISRFAWNGPTEISAYKPGMIRIVR